MSRGRLLITHVILFVQHSRDSTPSYMHASTHPNKKYILFSPSNINVHQIWIFERIYFISLTIVMKIPNSLFSSMVSPSVKTNDFFFSLRAVSTTATCWAATDSTGNSIRLNSMELEKCSNHTRDVCNMQSNTKFRYRQCIAKHTIKTAPRSRLSKTYK